MSTYLAAVPLSLYFSLLVYLISRYLQGYTSKETWLWWYCVIDEMWAKFCNELASAFIAGESDILLIRINGCQNV